LFFSQLFVKLLYTARELLITTSINTSFPHSYPGLLSPFPQFLLAFPITV
jgi:hypothetical protein